MSGVPVPGRRLSRDYSQWEPQSADLVARAVTTGLIVPDANVLLSLYEVAPSSREEILALLDRVADRLWIPDQVAQEYSRNRRRVVIDREERFSRARRGLGSAPAKAAAAVIEAATAVSQLNQTTRSTRSWAPDDAGLGKATVEKTIKELLAPARAELERLRSEHDITVGDIGSGDGHTDGDHTDGDDTGSATGTDGTGGTGGAGAGDHVFERVDELLAGRIGEPIDHETRRRLVEDAQHYRYPNDIPPGGADAAKATGAGAAGDYLLWWQTLRKAGAHDRPATDSPAGRAGDGVPDHIVLVTADAKSDWWTLNDLGKPLHPRPELAQEMFDRTGRRLVVLSSQQFVEVANTHLGHLGVRLSAETVIDLQQAAETVSDLAQFEPALRPAAGMLKERALIGELAAAFRRLGLRYHDNPRGKFDGSLTAEHLGLSDWVTVEVKVSGRPLGVAAVENFRYVAVGPPPSEALSGTEPAGRAILVSASGFAQPGGVLDEDDRVYLLGPEEINGLLGGTSAVPVLEWLLRDVPNLVDLDE